MVLWVELMLATSGSGPDWIPIVAVILTAFMAMLGAMASVIFWDMRNDIKRAVDTLETVLHRQENLEEKVRWLQGFHPTQEQLQARTGIPNV